ncbi:hypothetical protein [Candidatus Manganitrophus noduliformans]|uniref:Uncharacterized protein n=1 Tax=Candidatus Manganitrophus noduliformans TaxID=2606439 RepID=A0A7X6DTA9_9BACT|nr:hypothetical protein [Candidatus Manganitrophus noduliformans]NKE72769.1 hypothetical protein [Candidatus Manganitrophus noduliformans]
MKKLWVMALGTAFLLQTAALYAADVKFEGDFRVRGIYADDLDANEDVNDQQAFADGRFRLRTTATAGITSGVVVLDFTSSFSDPRQTGAGGAVDCSATGCTTGNYRFGSANFGGSYNIVGVREAYLKLDLNMVKLAFGRKPFRLGHSLILDDTMDAIVGKFMVGGFEVMLANGKLLDTNSTVAPGGGLTGSDTDLYIAKTGFNHGDMHNIGLFATYLKDRGPAFLPAAAAPDKTELWVLGVTADGKFGAINLGAEVDFLTGSQDVTTGDSVDLAGLNVLIGLGFDVGAVDVGVAALYTTGDDGTDAGERNVNGISGNFVLGNILINDNILSDREGQCASVGGARIGSGGSSCFAGLGVTGIKVSAGLEGVPFGKTCHTELAAIWAQTTEDPIGPGGAGDSDLGIEIDLNHKHKLDDNVAVAVNLGYLLSGDAWQTLTGGDDNQLKGIIALNYMF